jgi:hypothetical protein
MNIHRLHRDAPLAGQPHPIARADGSGYFDVGGAVRIDGEHLPATVAAAWWQALAEQQSHEGVAFLYARMTNGYSQCRNH